MPYSLDQQAEWTASRCFRVLRPIASRRSTARSNPPTDVEKTNGSMDSVPLVIRSKFGDSPNPRLDPDWLAKSRNLATRRYRKPTQSSSDDLPDASSGAWAISTPAVARLRDIRSLKESMATKKMREPGIGRDIFNDKFVSQADDLNFKSQKLVQGTLDLIEATNTCSTPANQHAFFPKTGARSLRAMSCKIYARQIVEIERAQESQTSDERFDVAFEAYELIEETCGTGASEYLRAITREYGVALFERTASEGRIPRSHAVALLRRMQNPQHSRVKHPSSAEVESILKVLFRTRFPDKPCCNRDNTYGNLLNMLAGASVSHDEKLRSAFEFRQFQDMAENMLPLCWFGSRRLTTFWSKIFHVFIDDGTGYESHETAERDASNFLSALVSVDCGLNPVTQASQDIMNSSAVPDYYGNASGCPRCPKMPAHAQFLNSPSTNHPHSATNNHASRKRLTSALSNSCSSLFAILASLAIATHRASDDWSHIDGAAIASLLCNLSMDVLESLCSPAQASKVISLERCATILVATLVNTLDAKQDDKAVQAIDINDLVRGLEAIIKMGMGSDGNTTMSWLAECVISTIHTTAKLLQYDAYVVLETIVSSLTSTSLLANASASIRDMLVELAFTSAEMFAERNSCKVAAELAQTLNKEHSRRLHKVFSPDSQHGFTPRTSLDREHLKWEDGIGEWIRATPGLREHFTCGSLEIISPQAQASSPPSATHDTSGLSTLLLSPASLDQSSPASKDYASPQKDRLNPTRRPLFERADSRGLTMNGNAANKRKASGALRRVSAKWGVAQTLHSSPGIEWEDELWNEQPWKRAKQHANSQRLVMAGQKCSDENEECDELLAASQEHHQARSYGTTQTWLQIRKSRGTRLRSLAQDNRRSVKNKSEDISGYQTESDDELSHG